ncbi:hypothetical protein HDV01_000175 [Terramyces sp. JEL0728]|nr:hypothetical protein HDV01_000175 [Terramyces sp. JEL0728]
MNTTEEEYDDDDKLFRELEEDDDHLLDSMRENRMQQLKKEIALEKQKSLGYGSLQVFKDEKQLMLMTTSTAKCVIHFSHKDFKKCATMDNHLGKLARLHPQTRFVKVDVENVPFLVDRMEIKVLPCIVSFIDGVGVDR